MPPERNAQKLGISDPHIQPCGPHRNLDAAAGAQQPVRSEETEPGCGSQVKEKAVGLVGTFAWRPRATSDSPGQGRVLCSRDATTAPMPGNQGEGEACSHCSPAPTPSAPSGGQSKAGAVGCSGRTGAGGLCPPPPRTASPVAAIGMPPGPPQPCGVLLNCRPLENPGKGS